MMRDEHIIRIIDITKIHVQNSRLNKTRPALIYWVPTILRQILSVGSISIQISFPTKVLTHY